MYDLSVLQILNTSFGISKYTDKICSEMTLIQFCNHIYAKLHIGKIDFTLNASLHFT